MKKLILTLAFTIGFLTATQLQAQQTNWTFTPPFNNSAPIVQWTVPQTGLYTVTAYGAQGGGINSKAPYVLVGGGQGAIISGNLQLTVGQILNILAGAEGGSTESGYPYGGGGGGGGSFVVDSNNNTPLVVAGGGGGVSGGSTGASNASTSTSGNNATGTDKSNEEGAGGTNGNGGSIGSDSAQTGGGGGGGFYTSGESHYANNDYNVWGIEGGYIIKKGGLLAPGGNSYLSGGLWTEANPGNTWNPFCYGGSGGGGNGIYGGYNASGPGGGGGYSGGGGGGSSSQAKGQTYAGGGGGSYVTPSATSVSMSVGNTGAGKVTISLVQSDLGNSRSPIVNFGALKSRISYKKGKTFRISAKSDSNGAIFFKSSNKSVLKIVGKKATVLRRGKVTITAVVAPTANHTGGTTTQSVTIR